MKNKKVTRTFPISVIKVTVFNSETDAVDTFVTELVGKFRNQKTLIKALKPKYETETVMIIKAEVTEMKSKKYSMDESDFIVQSDEYQAE